MRPQSPLCKAEQTVVWYTRSDVMDGDSDINEFWGDRKLTQS